jgi:protein arginine N-methyltransferase 1
MIPGSELVHEHAGYASDANRLDGFARALARAVKPGDRVLDLGAGTGLLGLLALRAGASRVYAVEATRLVELTRRVFAANGFADRVVVIRGHSLGVSLPEPVDVVVADQLANFGVEAGILEDFADARARHLAPGGRLVPDRLDLWLAPVASPRAWESVALWEKRPAGLDLTPVREAAANAIQSVTLEPGELVAAPSVAASLELGAPPSSVALAAGFVARSAATVHGLGGWFSAHAAGELVVTNTPGAPAAIRRPNVFLPFREPVEVRAGEALRATGHVVPPDIFAWTCEVAGRRSVQSNLHALPLDAADLRRSDPAARPALSARGAARRHVLELCDARHTLAEIEASLVAAHGALFPTRAAAAAFIASVVERDAE